MTTHLASTANRVSFFSITNPTAAKSLVKHLVKTPNDSIILPFIDHPGPLSREIILKKFRSLTVCERDPALRVKFQSFCQYKHPDKKVNIYPDDLFDLSFKTQNDAAQKRCAEIVRESLNAQNLVDITSDTGERSVKFLVPLLKSRYEVGFLRNLYYQMCLRLGLCSPTLVHYYFLMSDRQYMYLNAKPRENLRLYRSSTVLYNTIFKINHLESYDLEDCFGIGVRKIQKTAPINIESYRRVHLICLEPRLEILENNNPRSFVEFRFLVTQVMHRRKSLVVDFLDKFFDNYQDKIQEMGIDRNTRVGDLDIDQYFRLFLYLRNRPDYQESIFLQAAAEADDNFLIAN